MAKYVKFMRGTPEAFNRVVTKDDDTLYFISATDSAQGQLYLGSKQIICDNNVSVATALSQLTDVKLPSPLLQDQVLVYHIDEATGEEYWTAKNIEDIIGEVSANVETAVYQASPEGEETHLQAIARVVGTAALNQGDVAIVKELIADGKYQHTAYIYSDLEWVAMDGNYNAENVYFDENLITTHAIGNIKLTNGQGTINAAGKNLKQVFEAIFVKESNPSKTNPSVSVTLNKAGAYEVGEVVDGSWSASFSDGAYTYGPEPTGATVTAWSVTDSEKATAVTTNSGDFGDIEVKDGTNYTVTATATHTAGAVPVTNLGNPCADSSKQIVSGSKTGTSSAIRGYRAFFYGMSNVAKADFVLDSATIRGLTNGGEYNASKTLTFTASELEGVKRFIIAIPDSSTRAGVQSATITSSMNADALGDYHLQETKPLVAGTTETSAKVAYRVYIYEPASIASVEVHEVVLA